MLQRFGYYRVSGIDAEKNIIFDSIMKEDFPDFALLNESISPDENGDISYDVAFEPEELSRAQMEAMNNSVRGFLKSSFKKLIKQIGGKVPSEFPSSGLNYIDRPVFSHFMKSYLDNECFGGMTIATMYDPEEKCFVFGVSRCSDLDQYVKRIGNNLAYKNLVDNPIKIPVSYVEESLVSRGSQPGVLNTIVDPCKFIKSLGNGSLGSLIGKFLKENDEDGVLYKSVFMDFRENYFSR